LWALKYKAEPRSEVKCFAKDSATNFLKRVRGRVLGVGRILNKLKEWRQPPEEP
jgi:hypothetical protein